MFIERVLDKDGNIREELSKDLASRVDKAISSDFKIKEITDEDRNNKFYLAMITTLDDDFQTKILYERKVFTSNASLPKEQFLFGFKPRDSLCLILNKPIHKVVCCSEELARLNNHCFLVNGLQFLLQEAESERAWCYVPQCPCEHTCELTPQAMELRLMLWIGKPTIS